MHGAEDIPRAESPPLNAKQGKLKKWGHTRTGHRKTDMESSNMDFRLSCWRELGTPDKANQIAEKRCI